MLKPMKRLGRQVPIEPGLGKSLAHDCRNFEQAFKHFPVASVYEKYDNRASRLAWGSKTVSWT